MRTVVMIALLVGAADAQPRATGTIRGTIRDAATQAPMPGLTVVDRRHS